MRVALRTREDVLAALPALPVEPFSTRELAALATPDRQFGTDPGWLRRPGHPPAAVGAAVPRNTIHPCIKATIASRNVFGSYAQA